MLTFETTVKGGLPVVAEATREDGSYFVTDLFVQRRGKLRPVWSSLYRDVMANEAELRRLNREAELAANYAGY